MTTLRGSAAPLTAALALAWAPYAVHPADGIVSPVVQTVVFVGLVLASIACPRAKIVVVRTVQRVVLNPLFRTLHAVGLNPLGLVILETRGRISGSPRRTPVGNGRVGTDLWVIAEHGLRADYVRNIVADPRVRVRIRCGLHYRWVHGVATVLPDDDVAARQRRIAAWHPLRAFNAMNVRLMGVDPVTVRIAFTSTGAPVDPTMVEGVDRANDSTSVQAGL